MKSVKREIAGLTVNEAEKTRLVDMLTYQIEEIEAARLQPGEEEELNARRTVLKNSVKIVEAVEQAYFHYLRRNTRTALSQ